MYIFIFQIFPVSFFPLCSTAFHSEFKSSVPSPEIVAQPCNQKYIIIKATYRPILYPENLPQRLNGRETQIKGSKISNPPVWQNTVNQSKKEQHSNTTVLPKTPETAKNSGLRFSLRWASSSGQAHSISGTAVWGWKVTVWLCWVECLWDSITGLWLADWAASKTVYAEMHPAFHGRACLLKSCLSGS